MIKDPQILLLDEPTSALDPESEAQVQQAIDKIASSRTTLVIAHRLATVRNAHTIVVLDRGSVLESGSHRQLLDRAGHYAHLLKLASDNITSSHSPRNSNINNNSYNEESAYVKSMQPNHSHSNYSAYLKSMHEQELELEQEQEREKEEMKKKADNFHLSEVWKLQRPELLMLLLGFLLGIIAGAVLSTFPFLLGQALKIYFDKNTSKMKRDVGFLALALVGLGFGCVISMTGQQGFCGWAGTKLTKRVRLKSF